MAAGIRYCAYSEVSKIRDMSPHTVVSVVRTTARKRLVPAITRAFLRPTAHGSSFFVYLFLLLLGYSRAMFACFVERCTLQAFLDSHIAAFHYLGGVPAELIYDNMRNVVIIDKKRLRQFNPEIVDFYTRFCAILGTSINI